MCGREGVAPGSTQDPGAPTPSEHRDGDFLLEDAPLCQGGGVPLGDGEEGGHHQVEAADRGEEHQAKAPGKHHGEGGLGERVQ